MAAPEKYNLNLIFAITAAALGSGFQHGYHTGVINVPEKVLRDWLRGVFRIRTESDLSEGTDNLMWSVTTSIMNAGGTLGGILTALASTKLGPKTALLFNNVLASVAILLMFFSKFADSLEMMIIGRFIIGVNCGLNAGLCPMYLSEISPVNLRGAISSVYQLVITISILLAQIFGLEVILGHEDRWHYLFLLPIVFVIIQVVMLLFCSESPRYLISVKGDREKTQKSLQYLRKKDDVAAELAILEAEDAQVKALPKVTLKDMFKVRHLKIPLMIALVIMLAQQFSGINAVMFYSTATFEASNLSEDEAKYATIGIGLVNVAMTVVSVFLVDIAGRKTLLLVGFGGMAIDMTILCVCTHFSAEQEALAYICIVLTFFYVILFATGAGSIPWFLVTEVFNQESRPTAVSMAVPTNWIANFIVTLTFKPIQTGIGAFAFMIFVALDVVFFLFIWFLVPETKNKPVDEIISQWKKE